MGRSRQISNPNVIDDSKTIIRMMVQGTDPKNLILKIIIDRIHVDSRSLKQKFFHILRENNTTADKLANKAIGRPLGTLGVEGVEVLALLA